MSDSILLRLESENVSAPIEKLHPELIVEILQWNMCPYYPWAALPKTITNHRGNTRLVSRHWNNVVVTGPTLWRHIDINVDRLSSEDAMVQQLAGLNACVVRAGQLTRSLTIFAGNFDVPEWSDLIHRKFAEAIRAAGGWASVDFPTPVGADILYDIFHCSALNADNSWVHLEDISVQSITPALPEKRTISLPPFAFPMLRRVFVSAEWPEACIRLEIPWGQITEASLHDLHTTSEVLAILAQCSQLQQGLLYPAKHGVFHHASEVVLPPQVTVTLASLSFLDLSASTLDGVAASTLDNIRMPGLKTLHLRAKTAECPDEEEDIISAMARLLRRSQSQLKVLIVWIHRPGPKHESTIADLVQLVAQTLGGLQICGYNMACSCLPLGTLFPQLSNVQLNNFGLPSHSSRPGPLDAFAAWVDAWLRGVDILSRVDGVRAQEDFQVVYTQPGDGSRFPFANVGQASWIPSRHDCGKSEVVDALRDLGWRIQVCIDD